MPSVQVKNVPPDVHRILRTRAAEKGQSLQEFLLTPYDAAYVALAEALDVPLLTADARLASAPGIACEVELLS